MTTPVLPADIPANVARAAEVLRNGGLLALPTDTVYGLAAALDQPQALQRIYAVKGRQVEKALPVLISNAGELSRIAAQVSPAVRTLSRHFWPGPLTLIVPKRAGLSPLISPHPTVGVRVPNHPVTLALLRLTGPLAVTSANRSNSGNARTAADVLAQLGGHIDLILDGGQTRGARPSTVADCTTTPLTILRAGPIALDEILAVLGK